MAAAMDVGKKTTTNNVGQYQVKFITKLADYFILDTPFSVPSNVSQAKLSALINKILSESKEDHEKVEFDFLIQSKLLREELGEHIFQNNISEEDVLEIEYVEKYNAPEPKNSLNHDDWVSAVDSYDEWIVSGCYDNTLKIWTTSGQHQLTIPGHSGPVKGVKFIHSDDELKKFVSVSQDQTAMIWKWNETKNSVECINVCRGHARSVDCVAVEPNGKRFVTGSWDKMLKIWHVDDEDNVDQDSEGSSQKRQKTESGIGKTKVPIITLSGHHEPVSSLQWTGSNEVCSASWDHSIRLWDVEIGGMKSQLSGSKAFFNISHSKLNGYILSASADRHVRLWDPRVKTGAMMKNNFTSHTGWVSAVHWSPTSDHHFISGSHDFLMKLWDTRSSNAPLYDLSGHEEKIMCVNWSQPSLLMSGGSDNTLKLFKMDNFIT